MHQNKCSHVIDVMSHASSPYRPYHVWLLGPPSRGCYLLTQIFAGQSEAGIGIRSSKGVDWHYFHVTCFNFGSERYFEGAFFKNSLSGLFKLKYTFNKICRF
jgi:hypothetical protein